MNRYSLSLLLIAGVVNAQSPDSTLIPDMRPIVGQPQSELASVVNRFTQDNYSMNRRYDATNSPAQRKRMREFFNEWHDRIAAIDFNKLNQEGKIDYVLLNKEVNHELILLDRQEKLRTEVQPLIPFADRLLALQDTRRDMRPIDASA